MNVMQDANKQTNLLKWKICESPSLTDLYVTFERGDIGSKFRAAKFPLLQHMCMQRPSVGI